MGQLPAQPSEAAAAVETERQRIAALLEDRLVESLNLLLAQANAYEQALAAQPQARMAVSVLANLTRRVLQQVRDLEADLYPQVLETLGLEPALEALASQLMRAHGLHIALTLERLAQRPPYAVELSVFRVVQAALDRAVHQARASSITVMLRGRDSTVTLAYADNGIAPGATETLRAACDQIEALGGHATLEGSSGPLDLTLDFQLAPPVQLTPRESDVLRLLAEGLSNKAIGDVLAISPRTVNFHLDNVYAKLGVRSRTEAVIVALRNGLTG